MIPAGLTTAQVAEMAGLSPSSAASMLSHERPHGIDRRLPRDLWSGPQVPLYDYRAIVEWLDRLDRNRARVRRRPAPRVLTAATVAEAAGIAEGLASALAGQWQALGGAFVIGPGGTDEDFAPDERWFTVRACET